MDYMGARITACCIEMKLYPSNAHIWVKCAGHSPLAARTPRIAPADDTARLEGILAHKVADARAKGEYLPTEGVTQEMLDGANLWREVLDSWACVYATEVEYETIDWIGGDIPARTDAEGYNAETNTLHVGDYKFGHRWVDAFENWQLLIYAMAWLDRHNKEVHGKLDEMQVVLHVVQPRAGGHRKWALSVSDLRVTYAKVIVAAAANARMANSSPNGLGLQLYTVGEHCYKCAGAINCPALRNATTAALDFGGRAIELELTPEQAAIELFLIDNAALHIKNRRDALEQLIEHSLGNGNALPHWEMKRGRGSVKWINEAEVLALGELYGADISTVKLKTPKQCEKLLPAYIVESFTEQTQGALKLSKKNADDGNKLFTQE